ncbi:hypothetical protein [Runella sp.]|uniref:hypothetical protein n=1 Tax=Runella sp. TaxID=1960881 RepID=UPI003D10EA47
MKINNNKLATLNAGFNKDFWNGYCWAPDNIGNWLGLTGLVGKWIPGAVLTGFGGGLTVAQLICQYVDH